MKQFEDISLFEGDCLTILPKIKAKSVDLVFADPPFNIGIKYDNYTDKKDKKDYIAWAVDWVAACVNLLKPDGSIVVQTNDEYAPYYHLILSEYMGLTWRNTIIWAYTFGPHQKYKFGRNHCQFLYFVCDSKNFTFNSDAVRVKSIRQLMKDKRANPLGRIPGDVWEFPRIVGNSKKRIKHPCQTPDLILERIILALTNCGEVVCDPFAGSGTTLATAYKLGRKAIGVEISPNYCQLISQRLSSAEIRG